ncbi:MAG: DNA primase, partial [Rikenellaceae bacterium]|nr:DNA primase [Rikenellaceae bacterium]
MEVNSFAAQYFTSQLHDTPEGRNIGLSYFKERDLKAATLDKFSLGYCPAEGDAFTRKALEAGYKEEFLIATGLTIKRESGGYWDRFAGRVIFPVVSLSGRVIAFGGRTLRNDKKTAKYLNSPESEVYHKGKTLYGIYNAKKSITRENRCILVEGYMDVLSMVQAGVENVVASSGTSLTTEQIRLISRFTKNVTVIYDGDAAGIKASLRGIDMILSEGLNVRCVSLPDGDDPDSFARSRTADELTDYIIANEVDFITFKTRLMLDDVKDDPLRRAEVITDIVRSIASIPDSIARSEFARSCARMLGSDEHLIVTEVERRRLSATDGSQGGEVLRNRLRKEHIEESRTPAPIEVRKVSAREELEKELIIYLLRYGCRNFYFEQRDAVGNRLEPISLNVAEIITEELELDNITIESPLYKKLFDCYVAIMKTSGPAEETATETSVTTEATESAEISEDAPASEEASEEESADPDSKRLAMMVNNPDAEIAGFVVDMMMRFESRKPSKIWSRYDDVVVTEGDNLAIAVPKAIALYKLEVINNLIMLLSSQLDAYMSDNTDSEPDQEHLTRLSELRDLTNSRKLICQKYSRIL